MKELRDYVTSIPDFPKPGIIFRDITTIMSDAEGLKLAIDGLVDMMKGLDFDLVVGSESRGFIFGTPVAYTMGKGFILVRKKGKLPRETISEDYDLLNRGDTLKITDILGGLDSGEFTLKDVTNGRTLLLEGDFTDRQKAILKAGGLLKYVAAEEHERNE